MLNLMGQFEARENTMHDRIASLERQVSQLVEMEARLLIMIKTKDERIAHLSDQVAALTLDRWIDESTRRT
jgi:primosomal protein N''